MSMIPRAWLAFAAIGTGLIHVALVIGAPVPLAIVLATFGLLEFGWGVTTFARDSVPLPRVALVAAMLPIALWIVVLVASTATAAPSLAEALPLLPMAVATLFELVVAGMLAITLRRAAGTPASTPSAPSAPSYLVSLMAGALVVGALTTPALAATGAGLYAPPHGQHTGQFNLPSHDAH
ncbi:hypothetical protein IWX81_001509 [Salinibacterium sp. CAN_S4]|uniref:hypothetical protein n=1 Tax=Salinibacterium sp. CAN_S4 TaxID=2787727 RepID=UPI0018EF9EDB